MSTVELYWSRNHVMIVICYLPKLYCSEWKFLHNFCFKLEIWKSTVYEWDIVDVFVCAVLSWESECFLFICDAVIISSSTHTLSISLGCLPLTVMSSHTAHTLSGVCVCVSKVKCYLTDGNMLRSLTLCHSVCVCVCVWAVGQVSVRCLRDIMVQSQAFTVTQRLGWWISLISSWPPLLIGPLNSGAAR